MHFSVILAQTPVDQQLVCATGSDGLIGSMTAWLVSLMESVGGVGVALAIALESIFPPIPSEIILPLAGFTAARGSMGLIAAIIWATMGSLLGAWTLYGIARWFGLHRIHAAADRIPGVQRADVDKANRWFTKYGTWSVLLGRVIPVVRSLISIPAGFNRMNFMQFSLFWRALRPRASTPAPTRGSSPAGGRSTAPGSPVRPSHPDFHEKAGWVSSP